MAKEHKNFSKKRLIALWCMIVITAISALVVMEYMTLTRENMAQAYQSSDILVHEIEHIIAGSEADKENLEGFLRDTTLHKATAVSYLIDMDPAMEKNVVRLRKLAEMMGVDEIHLFNNRGEVYSGSFPQYYGMTLFDGEQIGYFQPMLQNHSMAMSQNIQPNTFEGRRMLYAMCWNSAGTRMIQVGIYEGRFPSILRENQIQSIIGKIPGDRGTDIILTDADSDMVIASTEDGFTGKNLREIGINLDEQESAEQMEFRAGTSDNPMYCTVRHDHGYRIIVVQYANDVNRNVPITLMTFTEYLILIFIAMSFVLDYMYGRFLEEKTFALKDQLTGLYNRREYENTLEQYNKKPMEKQLVFASMDVNGLKTVNDTMGHEAGDRLLQGAANCIAESFGPYGKTFRYGGDEFVALVLADAEQYAGILEHFENLLKKWSEENKINLRVSVGAVRPSQYPGADIHRLANLADQEMYRIKTQYYSDLKHDRRGQTGEDK